MSQIIVVEDDPDLRMLLVLQLKRQGHEAVSSGDGNEGLDLCRWRKPDLITLDWNLPGLHGLEICRAIRSDPTLAGTRVLIISARNTPSTVAEAQEAGADGFLAKPYDMSQLHERVATLLASPSLGDSGAMTLFSL